MKTKKKSLKLQVRYLLVAVINLVYNFIPFFLRNLFLKFIKIKVGKKTYIHRGVRFFHIGKIKIGNNSTINFNCFLDNRVGIEIGNNVGIAHCTKIYSLGHDIDDPEFKAFGKEVVIEDNVFIFSNCLIMPGVTIGEGAIVLTGAVVTKNVLPFTVVGGSPAKKIRMRSNEIKYKRDHGYWFAS
ncbi:acyltransferase [Algibacter pacificus]|uniref:acyltransferase n=1 Tax=Algibacter pacificus TaxID=2599389 RepID=UPI0011CA50D0|nr:acyltransferase [Algibacter pacificus]